MKPHKVLSINHLARKVQVLQDLQDLALNLASLALKMQVFLQKLKNLALILQELARKLCKIMFLQDMIKILQENYIAHFSCKFLQDQCKIFQLEKLRF